MTSRRAQLRAAMRIAEQRHDGMCERLGRVGAGVMAARPDAEPFGPHRGGDDGPRHGQRLEDLQARPAACPERHDVDGPLGDRRPDIVHCAGHRHPAGA